MTLFIVFAILLFVLSWILFSPIGITLNSQQGVYQIRWYGITTARLVFQPKDLLLRLTIFFWKKEFSLLRLKKQKRKKKVQKRKKKKRTAQSGIKTFKKILRIINSFEIKIFRVNLDTGNCIYNSYLFPVFYFLQSKKRRVNINYQGLVSIHVEIENRLYKILIRLLFP